MMGYFTSRIVRFIAFLLLLFGISRILVVVSNELRFQRHLLTRSITWDSFPRLYSNILQSKGSKALERDNFDYDHWFPIDTTTKTTATIPRTIHFIWFKDLYDDPPYGSTISSIGTDAPELCQKQNSTYNMTLWDAQEGRQLIEDHYPWFLSTYDAYRYPIQRIDALKYFILWHNGGIYMDLDIVCRRPLDPLLGFPAWFSNASPTGVHNDLMASRPMHPVFSLMIESLVGRNRNLLLPYLTIFWSTGPQFAGDMLKTWFLKHPTAGDANDTAPDDWFILPPMFYSEEHTFFGHSPGGSWHGQDVAAVLWLLAHPALIWLVGVTIAFGACLVARPWKRWNARIHFAGNDGECRGV